MKDDDRETRLVRPLRGGQVTIPAEFRRRLGITDETILRITLEDGSLRVTPMVVREASQGSPWLKQLYDLFAPVREEAAQYSEDEVNEAIDQAVRAVRREQRRRD